MRRPIIFTILVLFLVPARSIVMGQDTGEQVGRWLRQMDKNKDGKLSPEETTGLMKRFFSRNDANEDNILDRKELDALAKRLSRNRNPQNRQRQQSSMPAKQMLERVPDGVIAEPDVAYRPGDSKAWRLDLFRPAAKGDKPRPGIVFVHGGGWRSGDKRAGTFLSGAIEYAQKGYVTITVNYRLTGEAPFPAAIEDVKCAVRWFRAHAKEYNLDPKRIGAYGNSAGAHLASILGLVRPDAKLEGDGPWQDQSSLVQAVAASATPTDFNLFPDSPKSRERFKSGNWDIDELKRISSPINHVSKEAPPFLLFHGTADKTVHVKHSDTFVEALKKLDIDVTYIRIEDASHGIFNQHADRTKPAMVKFFQRTLGPRLKPM